MELIKDLLVTPKAQKQNMKRIGIKTFILFLRLCIKITFLFLSKY